MHVLEVAGRHGEAVVFAANAIEEYPGHEGLMAWEQRLLARDHDPNFNVHEFLFGKSADAEPGANQATIQADEPPTTTESQEAADKAE
jgi:hypothetical protein